MKIRIKGEGINIQEVKVDGLRCTEFEVEMGLVKFRVNMQELIGIAQGFISSDIDLP